jgi:hypothetical protein
MQDAFARRPSGDFYGSSSASVATGEKKTEED